MVFGIIAEGVGDGAVIRNILYGLNLIESDEDIRYLRPEFGMDATDLSEAKFSNWTLVKQECTERVKFEEFLNSPILEERAIILQIDTAECELKGYDVPRPSKDANYSENLRNAVVEKINEWLNQQFLEKIYYAISIEEMEAWIHTLYEEKDTTKFIDPKAKLQQFLTKKASKDKKFSKAWKKFKNRTESAKADFLSQDFQKITKRKVKICLSRNKSLQLFVESLPSTT